MRYHKSFKINITNAEFNCRVLGNGEINLIAFHGFGQDGNAFSPVAIQNPKYTIYSFDLPFHGETIIRNPSLSFRSHEVIELIQKLIDQFAIDRFSLMGFSIGAKFLFPILEAFHLQIEKVWLLAPDGIKLNFWYRAATGTRLMRYLFRTALHNYKFLNGLGNLTLSLKIMDKSTILFAMKSINTSEKREQVYYIWTYLRKLKLNSVAVSNKLNETNAPIYFMLGEHDKIIPLSMIEPLFKKLNNSKAVTLACGHQRLIENFTEWKSKNFN